MVIDSAGSGSPSRRIGPYHLVEKIGEGGMGEVWRARQHEPVDREVALKLVRTGGANAEVLSRFQAERQALAVLDHPAIARLYDAGAAPDGRPYFVMELVQGQPLLAYAARHRLTLPQRIRLVQDVCRGVQHAHQKGLIHRDLKPTNILVSIGDGRPAPKIIDFGIAKLMQADTALTQDVNASLGTPVYMSPEQLDRSTDIDTRSDLYALGVLLYELLTGVKPFDDAAYRGAVLLTTVLVSEPPLASHRLRSIDTATLHRLAAERRTSPASLEKELTGDLDSIIAKCLEKDRNRRYESANGLLLDLERHLADEPVLARPQDRSYRMAKFVRRNRVAVGFAATLATVLVGFAATTMVQNGRIRTARDLADTRRESAEELLFATISDLWGDLQPLGQLPLLNDVADAAVRYFSELPPADWSDEELRARSQLLYQIGDVRMDEGDLEAAGRAFEESLRLARAASARAPDDDERLFALGQSEYYAGDLRRQQGDLDGATESWERYRDISIELNRRDPDNLDFLMEVGYSHTNLGGLHRLAGNAEQALAEFQASAAIKEQVYASDPSPRRLYDLSRSYNTLGIALYDLARLDEARESLERDIQAKEQLLTDDPRNAVYLARLAASLAYLDQTLWVQGRSDEAYAATVRSVEIYRRLVALDDSNLQWRRNLSVQLARLSARQREGPEGGAAARTSAAEAVALMRTVLDQNPDEPESYLSLAGALQSSALAALDRSPSQARAAADEAWRLVDEALERFPSRNVGVAAAEVLLIRGDVEREVGGDGQPHWARARSLLDEVDPDANHHEQIALRAALAVRTGAEGEAERLDLLLRSVGVVRLPGLGG